MTAHPLSPSIVRSLLRDGMDTLEIANYLSRREPDVYNALGGMRLPAGEYADVAHRNLIRRSAEIQEQRKGKRRPISHAQNAATGKHAAPVTLARISIVERSE